MIRMFTFTGDCVNQCIRVLGAKLPAAAVANAASAAAALATGLATAAAALATATTGHSVGGCVLHAVVGGGGIGRSRVVHLLYMGLRFFKGGYSS